MRSAYFGGNFKLRSTWRSEPGGPQLPLSHVEDKGQAVAHLMRHQELVSRCGEYEVRTTLDIQRAWRYRCSVWWRGKELKRGFVPIVVDLDHRHLTRQQDLITEEIYIHFTMEAVDLHMSRWEALQKYLIQGPGYPPAPRRYQRLVSAGMAVVACATLVAGYWLWMHQRNVTPKPPAVEPSPQTVRWQQDQALYELPGGKRFALLLPPLENLSESEAVAVTIDVSGQRPSWLHFSPTTLAISGTAPISAIGSTFHVIFHARPERGHASALHVYMAVTP